MTTHILSPTPPKLTKDSAPVVYEEIECFRCGIKSDIGFLHIHDREGMDYLYTDSPNGFADLPEWQREYVYVCYDCDWKLMNGYPMEYDELEAEEDEEMF